MLVTVTFRIPPKDAQRLARTDPDSPGYTVAIQRAIRQAVVKALGIGIANSDVTDGESGTVDRLAG